MAELDDLKESEGARPRRSDVQGKFYNFLNRSAQSLSRSNSQSGRSRRAKDKDSDKGLLPGTGTTSTDRGPPRVSHAAQSRLPINSGNARQMSQARLSSSARTPRSFAASDREVTPRPRKSPSPPVTPLLHQKRTLSSVPQTSASAVVYSYNTPPQTPSRSRKYSNPSSPSSIVGGGRDLLLNRPLARPITPSNSSSGKKVFGIPIPSPSPRKGTFLEVETPKRHSSHKGRSGSGSSNEPLLHDQSPSNEDGRTLPRPGANPVTPRATPRPNRTPEEQTPLPTPSSSLPRSQRSALSAKLSREEQPPASPTTNSRRGTSRLDFWRSFTPRPRTPSAQGDREKDKGKQRATTPDASRSGGRLGKEKPSLVSPQPRAPVTFLPRFQRTPATPRRGEEAETSNTIRLDSFMSDSVPVQQSATQALKDAAVPNGLAMRQPAFTSQNGALPQTPCTPGPERKPAPAVGIQRSNSAPGTRGRLSPCLRIPSPKFLTRERSKEREKEKEMLHEKKRVTPENVSAPIIRETRTALHAHTFSHGNVGEKAGLKAPKTSFVQLRRAAHGTFDFERPGSRTSSNGQSESRGTDDEREKEKDKENEVENRRRTDGRPSRPPEPMRAKLKTPSPVPPLPTSRLKPPRSPPVRTRSPLGANPPPTSPHAHSPHVHIDDSALPRLSSNLVRRNTATSSNQHSRTHARSPASLPHFSFEPAAPRVPSPPAVPQKPAREGGGQYIDTRTGLIMYASKTKEDPPGRRSATPRRVGTPGVVNGHAAKEISQRQIEEATAVIAEFKSALNEAGFATLQKYVRRYDAQIISLEGGAGLLARVQRLLDTSAPRVDERRKRQLYESFARIVSQVS